jgi:glycosyltransferase involved in cell wall biosynthesis
LRSVGPRNVVHAHMTAAELPAAILKRRMAARLVVTRHFVTHRGRSLPGRAAAAVIERRIDLQVATSEIVARATPTPCVVIHNGVRPSSVAVPREPVVLLLQRLEQEKDAATAVRAWAQSGLAASGWRLVICGTGTQETALRALVAELGVASSVRFAGFTDDPRGALRAASILLAPALADSFGLAVVEAMAEGTPVVATQAGAHPETLGADGCYFPPGDAAACAAELVRLAGDEAERERRGARLRERQRAEFSIARHVDRLEQEYRRLLATALPLGGEHAG